MPNCPVSGILKHVPSVLRYHDSLEILTNLIPPLLLKQIGEGVVHWVKGL